MRYLFYAGLVPVVLAQSAFSAETGFAHSTGGVVSKNESATWYRPVPVRQSSSTVLPEPTSSEAPSSNTALLSIEYSTALSSKPSHAPFTKSAGLFFSNTTAGFAQPTGNIHHVSGTASRASASGHLPCTKASSYPLNVTSVVKPTGTGNSHISGTGAVGHLPYTKGSSAFFANGTLSVHPTGTAGFVKPSGLGSHTNTAKNTTKLASSSGHLPFSSGAHFFNATSTSTPLASGTGVSHPSGSGVSGFAKPSTGSNFTSPTHNNTSKTAASASVRLPITKGQSAYFGNGTSSGVASLTQGSYLHSASGHLPITKTGGLSFQNSTSLSPQPTGIPSSGSLSTAIPAIISPSGRPLYTKTSGALFLNSTTTKAPALSTGVFATGNNAIVTNSSSQIISTSSGVISSVPVGTGLPITRSSPAFFTNSTSNLAPTLPTSFPTGTSAPFVTSSEISNSTSSTLPRTSSQPASRPKTKSRKPHHGHTVTVTVTAAPVTITQAGSTITDYTTILPSTSAPQVNASRTSSSLDETTTVTFVQSLSSAFSSTIPTTYLTSVAGGNLAISTSAASNATSSATPSSIVSAVVSSSSSITISTLPTTLATLVSSALPSPTLTTSASGSLTASSAPGSASASASAVVQIKEYYQCGGLNWTGSGKCTKGNVCKYWNPYYSQCVDARSA